MRRKKHISGANVPLSTKELSDKRTGCGRLPSSNVGTFLTVPRLGRQFGSASYSLNASALSPNTSQRRITMPLGTILLIILIVLLIGALPTWPYSGGWGFYSSSVPSPVLSVLV